MCMPLARGPVAGEDICSIAKGAGATPQHLKLLPVAALGHVLHTPRLTPALQKHATRRQTKYMEQSNSTAREGTAKCTYDVGVSHMQHCDFIQTCTASSKRMPHQYA